MSKARRWTQAEITVLLGALGADASIESVAARTGHSVKAVLAKIARLDYRPQEIHGFAIFNVDELADYASGGLFIGAFFRVPRGSSVESLWCRTSGVLS